MKKNSVIEQVELVDQMVYILQKEILTFEEACIYLGRKPSYMYKMTSKRLIPHYSPSGKVLYFKRSELDEWVLKNKRKTIDEMRNEMRFRRH